MLILLFSLFFGFLGLCIGQRPREVVLALDPQERPDETPVTDFVAEAPQSIGLWSGVDRRRVLKNWEARVLPEPRVQPSV